MFPIRDENPTIRRPVVTVAIIAMNVAVWLLLQGTGNSLAFYKSLCHFSLIPADLLNKLPVGTVLTLAPNIECILEGRPGLTTLISHAFMHGSWFHMLTNMWFLWIFGDNVEDAMDKPRFILFYVLCILVAAFAQIVVTPSAVTPMVGASGAIGGIMGAYARLYPKANIHMVIVLVIFITTAAVPAVYMLGYWFFIQLVSGLASADGPVQVAFGAHVGGFIAGLILVGPLHRKDYLEEHNSLTPYRTAKYRL